MPKAGLQQPEPFVNSLIAITAADQSKDCFHESRIPPVDASSTGVVIDNAAPPLAAFLSVFRADDGLCGAERVAANRRPDTAQLHEKSARLGAPSIISSIAVSDSAPPLDDVPNGSSASAENLRNDGHLSLHRSSFMRAMVGRHRLPFL